MIALFHFVCSSVRGLSHVVDVRHADFCLLAAFVPLSLLRVAGTIMSCNVHMGVVQA